MDLGKRLGVKRYVAILRDDSPSSAVNFSYGERRYVLLTYLRPTHGDAWPSVVAGSSLQVDVWIDSATGLLAKTRAVAASALSGGVPLEFEQIFVAWSEDIRIEAPPGALKMNKKVNK